MNSDTPSRGFRGSSIEDTNNDKEDIAGAAHGRLAENVSSLRADMTKVHEPFRTLSQKRADMLREPRAMSVRQSRHK
jgi:hypothetical protein